MFNIVTVGLINIFAIIVFFLHWNKIDQALPLKKLILSFGLLNSIIIVFWILTDSITSNLIIEWSNIFERSLQNWYIYSLIFSVIFFSLAVPFLYKECQQLISHKNRRYLLIAVVLFLVALGLWIPFGFKTVGEYELWLVKQFFLLGPPHNLTDEMTSRLSILIPHTWIQLLNADSFIAYNILHLLLTFLRGALCFAILKKFDVRDIFALGVTTIFTFYPSTTEAQSLRNITIIFSFVIFLFAIYTFLSYQKRPTRFHLIVFFVMMFFSATYNEYVFLHIVFFPLLLFYFDRRITHKFINLTIIWYIIPIGYVSYYYLMSGVTEVFGEQFIESTPLTQRLTEIIDINQQSFTDLLVTNWQFTLTTDVELITYILITLIVAIAIFSLGLYLIKTTKHESNIPVSGLLKMMIVGTIVIVLSASMFGIFERPSSDWRIYSSATLGAAIIITSCAYFLAYFMLGRLNSQLIFIGIISLMSALGFFQSINQHKYYSDIAQAKTKFLAFTKNIDVIAPNGTWVFVTNLTERELTKRLGYFIEGQVVDAAIDVTLRSKTFTDSFICSSDSSRCKYHSKRLTYKQYSPPDTHVPYEQIVFFWIDTDLSVHLLETLPDELTQLSYAKKFYQPFTYVELKSN